ncbi:hypothetical protein [Mariniflexile sp. AS56]|uniref:hypothetical protein n=1 Tax=Mariniflexile sp. AS56 TaxID=3063957 RepID=UPI0026EBB215|nr:hypothetical protein [Mariniflexile sp. AS56]MDO7173252.1 hypothetical protein [Mariniflexile sp. AS56]
MKFENSPYFELKHYKIEMPFGDFYFIENFFISEMHEGVHFDWEMIQSTMVHILEFYGPDSSIGYISNRVNSYSMSPQTWSKVQKKYNNMIVAGAIVTYTNRAYLNASLEKQLTKTKIKRCFSLEEAINRILDLREFTHV